MEQVTQSDREAAAGYLEAHESPLHEHPLREIINAIRAGEVDDNTLVEAFAAHRRTTDQAKDEEIARLREALEGATKLLREIERLHDDIIITGDIEHFEKPLTENHHG